jgi:hypothetical protein
MEKNMEKKKKKKYAAAWSKFKKFWRNVKKKVLKK